MMYFNILSNYFFILFYFCLLVFYHDTFCQNLACKKKFIFLIESALLLTIIYSELICKKKLLHDLIFKYKIFLFVIAFQKLLLEVKPFLHDNQEKEANINILKMRSSFVPPINFHIV